MVPRCCGKKIGMFDESFDTHLSQFGASHEKTRGSEREQYACLMTSPRSVPLTPLDFFLRLTSTDTNDMFKVEKFQG
jgi:hypothetical protein